MKKILIEWTGAEIKRLRLAMETPNKFEKTKIYQELAVAGGRTLRSVRAKAWLLNNADRKAKQAEARPIAVPKKPELEKPFITPIPKSRLMGARA